MNQQLQKIFARLTAIGAASGDSDDLRLQKSLLVMFTFPFLIAGVVWGIMYFMFGEKSAAIIPLSYAVVSLLSILHFSITRNFVALRFTQLLLILLLPIALMVVLGGFVKGSVVIMWALISPLGAMLFYPPEIAPRWLIAFIILAIASSLLQPWLGIETNLKEGQIKLFFLINLIAVGSLIFSMFYYFVTRKNFFQARSESLLLNILPKQTAEELKANGKTEAKHFESVTVMFTDFKNFTKISEELSPAELVSEIDECFKTFDNIIGRHNIEKIKTIGDAYMCAGGLPVINTTHAFDVVSAALEIQQFISNRVVQKKAQGKQPFEIRIGIHTGPVVAGVVGIKKFAYDIWGDTVNIASRMESSGEAGKINISGATYELVKQKFHFLCRGKIEAKNKGMIEMYFVEAL